MASASTPLAPVVPLAAPRRRHRYLLTLLDPPAVWEIEAVPEDGGWCVTVRPLDGSPPWDTWIDASQGIFLRFLDKIAASRG